MIDQIYYQNKWCGQKEQENKGLGAYYNDC